MYYLKSKENGKENGVTLIALIVTIIVLIILAGISITTLTGEDGLIDQATNNSEEAQKESIIGLIEAELLKEKTKTGNTPSIDDLKTIIQNGGYNDGTLGENSFVTKEGGYTINYNEIDGWKNNLSSMVQPGDYVAYTPDTVDNEKMNNLLTELNTYSGSSGNNSDTLKQESLNWRVLDVQGEQVRLISEEPTTSTIGLYGAKGYNNLVYLIDKTCEELYSNSKFSVKAQNLKIEDIEEKMTYDYKQYANSNVDTGKYGGFSNNIYTTNAKYPAIYSQENGNGVGGFKHEGVLGLSEQKEPIVEGLKETAKLGATQTYWKKTMSTSDFTSSIYYEIFINKNGTNYDRYLLSSRNALDDGNNIVFCINAITEGGVFPDDISLSSGIREQNSSGRLRPVITLNSNVITTGGDGQSAGTAYQISI